MRLGRPGAVPGARSGSSRAEAEPLPVVRVISHTMFTATRPPEAVWAGSILDCFTALSNAANSRACAARPGAGTLTWSEVSSS